jgi:hypothetical protein
MEQGLKTRTGKSLDQWIAIVRKTKLEKHGDILSYLKSTHGFAHGYANFVALKTRGADAASHDGADLIAGQYEKKPDLRPIYEKLAALLRRLGPDVQVVPKKANVSFVRKTQFALVQPSTKTRIDLGLKLKGVSPRGRLEGSGPFGSMCTHRIQLAELSQIDDELAAWVRQAYDMAN